MDLYDSAQSSAEEEEEAHLQEEEEDDDIIIIQEPSHHRHRVRDISILEESQGYSPSQHGPESQRTPPRQYPRQRRQEPSLRPSGTAAVLAASQEEARRYYSNRDINSNNNDSNLLLNQSNPFAGLEALLDQSALSMSMTQEDENQEEDEEEEEDVNDDRMQVPGEQAFIPNNSNNADDYLDASKENSRNYLPQHDNFDKHKAIKLSNASLREENGSGVGTAHGRLVQEKNHDGTLGRQSKAEDFPMNSDDGNELGFTPMFEEESRFKTGPMQRSSPEDDNDLDREIQKQRSKRASLSSLPAKPSLEKARTRDNNNNSMMMMQQQQDVQPSKALRQHLQKDRRPSSKKTSRSKSADKIQLPDRRPSKRTAVRPRSTSPMIARRGRGSSSSTRSKSPVQVPVEKANRSLVGLRPSHWGRGGSTGPPKKRSASPFSDSGRSASATMLERQRKQLADACNSSSFLMAPPNARRQGSRSGNRMRSASPVRTMNSLNASMAVNGPVNASVDNDARQAHQTSNNVFAAGNPVMMDAMEIDTIEDNMSDDMEEANDSAQNVSFLALARANNNIPKGSGRRKSTGQGDQNNNGSGLLQLLQKIRTEVRTDKTRLRSGEYPFPNKVSSRFDLYDPRNRATSYLDVTIIGDSWSQCHENGTSNQWSRQARPTNSNMVILGYIHNHHIYPDRNKLPAGLSIQASQCLAWINFSGETIQEHSLLNNPQGSQMRIYNPLIIPVVLDERVDTIQDKESSKVCRYNIVCTQLCEPYPTSILGNLEPALSQILAAQA